MQYQASTILEQSPLGFAICDREQRIVSCNQKFLDFMGLPDDQVVGRLYPSLPIEVIDKKGHIAEKFTDNAKQNSRFHYWQSEYSRDPQLIIHYFMAVVDGSKINTLHSLKLPKKASWIEFLDYEVSRSRRYANPLSILKLQVILDNQPAELEQETICQTIKDTLMDELRWADMIGNTSRGSYLMVLPETPFESLNRLQQKIAKAICRQIKLLSSQIDCHVAFGSAHWRKLDDSEKLLKRARESLVATLETMLDA